MTPEPGFSTRALRAQSDELVRKLDVRERAVLVAILRAQGARDRTPEGDVLRVASGAQDRLRHLAQRGLIETCTRPSRVAWARHQDITR